MKNDQVTLVDPKQIAKKGYAGCKSTKAVVSFCKKYGVPCLWYKPANGQKVLLVETHQFGNIWKQVKAGTWNTSSNKSGYGWNRTSANSTKSRTTKRATMSNRSNATRSTKKNARGTNSSNRWNSSATSNWGFSGMKNNTRAKAKRRTSTTSKIRKMATSNRRNSYAGRMRRAA